MDARSRRLLGQRTLDIMNKVPLVIDDLRFWYDAEYDAVRRIAEDFGVSVDYAYEAANELMCEIEQEEYHAQT